MSINYSIVYEFAEKHGLNYNELANMVRSAIIPVTVKVLATPLVGEPVAYRHMHDDGWEYYDAPTGSDCKECQPLYTARLITQTEQDDAIKQIQAAFED